MQWMNIQGTVSEVEDAIISMLKNEIDIPVIKSALLQLETICDFTKLIGISVSTVI